MLYYANVKGEYFENHTTRLHRRKTNRSGEEMANTIALLMFLGIVPGFSFGFLCHHRRRLSWKSFWGIVIASTGPFWFYVFGQNDPMGAASWTIFFQYLSWMIIFILGYLGMGLFVQPKKQH